MLFKKVILTLLVGTLAWSSDVDNTNNKSNKRRCIVKPHKDNNIKSEEDLKIIKPTNEFQYVTDKDFIITEFRGDYGLDEFLENGGGDEYLQLDYVFNLYGYNATEILAPLEQPKENSANDTLACSALFVPNDKNGYYFGKNYDMYPTKLLVLVNHPDHGYSSISSSDVMAIDQLGLFTEEEMYKLYSIIYPVDGFNEKGLFISLQALPFTDPDTLQKEDGKPTISYVNAVRVILDKAATVDEAIDLLKSMNYRNLNEDGRTTQNVHYMISDASGQSVAVEYYNNTMYVTETSVMTNYYVSEDVKVGHNSVYEEDTRYDDLLKRYKQKPIMNYSEIKDTLPVAFQKSTPDSVNTEWTIIFDTLNLEAVYYRKMDYQHGYRVKL